MIGTSSDELSTQAADINEPEMPRVLRIIFRCVWAFAITATAVGFGAAYGWEKHGVVAAVALGFVGLVVSAPFAYSPTAFFQLLAEILMR